MSRSGRNRPAGADPQAPGARPPGAVAAAVRRRKLTAARLRKLTGERRRKVTGRAEVDGAAPRKAPLRTRGTLPAPSRRVLLIGGIRT